MNNEKISLQEVADLLASKASISKRASEEFLKIMFLSIEEALLVGDSVKIKNFGTFKVVWNEPRKSVNIQTGDEIILAGYYKVSFIPDLLLKDLVNEPYAHLKSVELDNEYPIDQEDNTEVALDPLRVFTEQAAEIKDLISEIQSLSTNPKTVLNDTKSVDPVSVVEPKKEEIQIEEVKEEKKSEPIQSIEELIFKREPVVEPVIEPKAVSKPETVNNTTSTSDFVFASNPQKEQKKKKPKKKLWFWLLVILLLIGCLKVSLYLFYPPVTKWTDSTLSSCKTVVVDFKDRVAIWITPNRKPATTLETVVVPKDSFDTDSINAEKPVDSLQILFDSPRIYPEFIATVRIRRGSRLALISKKYYGKSDFWVYIYEANNKHIPNPDKISSGTLIRIPKLDPRLIDASNPRCVRKARELHDLYVK